MPHLNRVQLIGALTRDPDLRYTPSGTPVAHTGIAVNRRWRNSRTGKEMEDTTFVDVEFWGREAEIAGEFLAKGRLAFVEGRLCLRQWIDKDTGKNRSRLIAICENLVMIDWRGKHHQTQPIESQTKEPPHETQ